MTNHAEGIPSPGVSLNERSPGTTKVVEVISRECPGGTCKLTTVGDSTFTANHHVWSGKLDNRLHVCKHWVARQQKMEAFIRGSHVRLGAASQVSRLDDAMLFLIAGEVLGDLLVENFGSWIQAGDFPGAVTTIRQQDKVYNIFTNNPERGIVLGDGIIAHTIQSIGRVDVQATSLYGYPMVSHGPPAREFELHPRGRSGLIDRMQYGDKCTVIWNTENSFQSPSSTSSSSTLPPNVQRIPITNTR